MEGIAFAVARLSSTAAAGAFTEDWPTLRVALSSTAAAGAPSKQTTRKDDNECRPLLFFVMRGVCEQVPTPRITKKGETFVSPSHCLL